MQAVDFWGPIATSVYPQDEGTIAPDIHIQRALGGPIFSLIMSVVTGLVFLAVRPFGQTAVYVAGFLFADNLLVLTLGAMLPLGFTDGSTLLHWMRQRRPTQRVVISGS